MAKQGKSPFQIELRKSRKGATDKALAQFERQIGVKLPSEYRTFLACQNGGEPILRNLAFGKKPYQDTVLRGFLGVEPRGEFSLPIILQIYKGRIPAKMLPIADDEGDNLLLISTARGSTGSIWFWDHEQELGANRPTRVAASLRAMLAKLTADEVKEYEIATITYRGGVTTRRILPHLVRSADRRRVLDVAKLKPGQRFDDFGKTRTVAKIEITRELW